MFEIQISNEQSRLAIDEPFITSLVKAVLETERVQSASISVAVITDELIHELNRRHLNHDYATDVLSFVLHSSPADAGPRTRRSIEELEGEVIVSADTAIREGVAHGIDPVHEFAWYVVHGTLHLCGYDDHEDADRTVMRQRERDILSQFNIMPVLDDGEPADLRPAAGENR